VEYIVSTVRSVGVTCSQVHTGELVDWPHARSSRRCCTSRTAQR